jgi:ABC-type proline/glycine betaine transport system permease subunit
MNEQADQKANKLNHARSKNLGQIALEVFSIVLAVLLALAVSEWQEDRNNVERANIAITNVRAELQSNLEVLQIISPINTRVVEAIAAEKIDEMEDASVIPGVQMRTSAWQTLGSTGSSNYIDYDLLIVLSKLYSLLEVYMQVAYSFINSNMDMAATATAMGTSVDNDLFSVNFLTYFQMLVQIETALIEAHQEAIESIDQASES